MSEVEQREVWLLIQAPRDAPPEVKYSRIKAVYTSRRRAERAKAALPWLVRRRSHISREMVRVTGPVGLPLDGEFGVVASRITAMEKH